MSTNYLSNEQLNAARQTFINTLVTCGYKYRTETIRVSDACGRTSASAIYAKKNSPDYPSSAKDGIAIVSSLSEGACKSRPLILEKDQYTFVDTGMYIPDGFDAVVKMEDVLFQKDGKTVIFSHALPWQNIRPIGEDICIGEMILQSHTRITPAAMGSMLASGVSEIEVIKRPVVGLIYDETEHALQSILESMLAQMGAESIYYPAIKDNSESIKAISQKALSECDIIILNTGSSAGRDDFSFKTISDIADVLYHGLAIKPGKPAILAHHKEKAVIGIPGYPVSGIIIIDEILRPVIDLWYDRTSKKDIAKAKLSKAIKSSANYTEFVRVRLGYVNDQLVAFPLNRGAGIISSFMKADGIVCVPQSTEEYETGCEIDVALLKSLLQIKNTVVAVGSHDPLLDELSDILHKQYPAYYMNSVHVGSMGGITAVKRSESHLSAIHLLNEKDGIYNEFYVRKNFPGGGVRLVECVGRIQGLMISKGNPYNIKSLKDICHPEIRFINRQKGSGTRILFDYLLKKNGIPDIAINGYDRLEYTHSAAAIQIASGAADVGLGIYSAAQNYGLDFIPVCTEQYDLLIPDYAWENDAVQKLIEILKSREFKDRLDRLGGYSLDKPGEIRMCL